LHLKLAEGQKATYEKELERDRALEEYNSKKDFFADLERKTDEKKQERIEK